MIAKNERPRILLITRSIVLNKKKKILFIRRARKDGWKDGFWEIPGGKLDEGQDISHALEREVFEEASLLVNPINRLAFFESTLLTQGKYKGLTYICLVGISLTEDTDVRLSEEHDQFKWVEYKKALEMKLTDETRKALIALKKPVAQLTKKTRSKISSDSRKKNFERVAALYH